MNEGIVEAGEDAGNTENELACSMRKSGQPHANFAMIIFSNIPSPARGPRETFSLALGAVLGAIVDGIVVDGIWRKEKSKSGGLGG